jgi:hypothetical protein
LLVTLAAGWLVIETRRLRQDLATSESRRATQAQRERELQKQVAEERQRSDHIAAALARQQNASQTASSPETSPSFASLILTIASTRSSGAAPPAVLVIPARTKQVRIQVNLRERDYPRYSALLQSAGGEEIFAWQRLTSRSNKSGASFVLNLPASKFIAGDYILTLKGIRTGGEVEDVSKSLFRVEKK